MTIYRHTCRACELDWDENYSVKDEPPTNCPECDSTDVYRNVTTSGAVFFKGGGWSPEGYNKHGAYDNYDNVKLYDRKEDIDRDMRGEAKQRELRKLKHLDKTAKRAFGPDAALTQNQADKAIKKAGEDAV